MMSDFCRAAFQVNGCVRVKMTDGRDYTSQFPAAVWRWLEGKDWQSITVRNNDYGHSYGWDRL